MGRDKKAIALDQKFFLVNFGLHFFIFACFGIIDAFKTYIWATPDSPNLSIIEIISIVLLFLFLGSYILCIRGCFLYSQGKGYPSQLGILGLFSFWGLCVLFLLPNKNKISLLKQNIDNPFEDVDLLEIIWRYIAIGVVIIMPAIVVILTIKGQDYDYEKTIYFHSLILISIALMAAWILKRITTLGINIKLFFGDKSSLKRYLFLIVRLLVFKFMFARGLNRIILYYLSFLFPDYIVNYVNDRSFTSFTSFIFICIGSIIFAPVIEEFIFRGLMLHKWGIKWGVKQAILVSSLVFAIVHFRFDLIPLFVGGVLYSVLYLKTKNLAIPILLHSFYNCLVMILNAIDYFGTPLSERNLRVELIEIQEYLQSSLGESILLVSVSAPFLIYFIYKNFPKNNIQLPYFSYINKSTS